MKIIKTLALVAVLTLVIAAAVSCQLPGSQTEATTTTTTEPACEHMWTAATCETPKTCVLCNEIEGEARGHEIVVDAAVAATCETAGLTAGEHCTKCDYVVAQEEVAALGHTEIIDAAADATCAAPGLTEGKHCETCGTVLLAQEEIARLAHKIAYVTTLPTAEANGSTVGTCSVCNSTFVYGEVGVMSAGTYVLEGSALSGIAQYSLADGEVKVVGGVFECHLSNKYRTDDGQKKTFADGYFGASRLNYGGKTEINSEDNPDMIKNGIVITTTDVTTITIWWVAGGDGRQVGLYDMNGNLLVKSEEASVKNETYISTFTVEAGTYIIGNVDNTNYHFKVEVVVGAPAEVPAE